MLINELKNVLVEYIIKPITAENIEDVFHLMRGNKYFYSKTQNHEVTIEECLEDIDALPPRVAKEKKTFVALYDKDKCIAVIDFIEGFPKDDIGYLGLLMVDESIQGNGVGKNILTNIFKVARDKQFKIIELACYETNKKGFEFWSKMGFFEVGKSERETDGKIYNLISMQCRLFL
ncbi:GNAT superfamily N-acetyltransferase [Sedimentibacter acidaminivorans]|uniref:GNAT superfamily N-acetyltransferase n=1 Tax=Sedimentibacter acidaminivorans TaxID=913099 RepID=A0ABS4GHM1_9FIRM|nr:GNAT family N-acetyltransferase [Sedimentibacter acidaminivorans]MBP1927183.1 GNAT superfamily N-acetyltransferase [Sedimentibacter acidaminivorans]